MDKFDVAVIGWGKGGKTLAGALARAGQKVAMIERSAKMVGGACINVACIPTKALIHSAEARAAKGYDPEYFAEAVERRDRLTGAMRDKNYSMLADLESVVLFEGHARFTGPNTLSITRGDDQLEISADTIIINTGSRTKVPDIAGAEIGGRIHTSTTLQHSPLPENLIVVGGGYVGIEFASMFSQYGSTVTVLDKNDHPMPREDQDVGRAVTSLLKDSGVRLVSGAQVLRICQENGCAAVQYLWNDQEQTVRGDAVLIALGRRPASDELDLDKAGIATTDAGAVKVDEHLRTSVPHIFAIGDVNGGPQFTYISLDDYRIVADQLLGDGKRSTADRKAIPATTFTTPPFSRVGITEREARDKKLNYKVAVKQVANVAAMPRPKIVGDPRGLIKVIVDADTDLILGASLIHVDSHEVINLVALAMRHDITASELQDTIYIHPSSSEALNEVLAMV